MTLCCDKSSKAYLQFALDHWPQKIVESVSGKNVVNIDRLMTRRASTAATANDLTGCRRPHIWLTNSMNAILSLEQYPGCPE